MTAPRNFRCELAASYLAAGAVIAHPTEAVWGLACRVDEPAAVARILELKSRAAAKGLLLVAESAERFAPLLAPLPQAVQQRIHASWPGAVTWVVPDPEHHYPAWIRGDHNSVALRVSEHPLTAGLCAAADSAIVSTSANPAGQRPAQALYQARRYFGDAVDYYLGGATGGRNRPSTIIDALTGEVLRS